MYEWTGKAPSSGREPEDGMRTATIGLWKDTVDAMIDHHDTKSQVVLGDFVTWW